MVQPCSCGFPVAKRTSWTHDNPGRKFIACKFFNHETGQRGCNTFEWVDEGMCEWQRDVINVLVAEKYRLASDNYMLNTRLARDGYEKKRLEEEVKQLKSKGVKKNESGGVQVIRKEVIGMKPLLVSSIVSVFVSFIVMKLLG